MPAFQKAIERALAYRQASLTYTQSARIFAAEELGFCRAKLTIILALGGSAN
jgi:hypothetical protein